MAFIAANVYLFFCVFIACPLVYLIIPYYAISWFIGWKYDRLLPEKVAMVVFYFFGLYWADTTWFLLVEWYRVWASLPW